jgi:hypothetical protein
VSRTDIVSRFPPASAAANALAIAGMSAFGRRSTFTLKVVGVASSAMILPPRSSRTYCGDPPNQLMRAESGRKTRTGKTLALRAPKASITTSALSRPDATRLRRASSVIANDVPSDGNAFRAATRRVITLSTVTTLTAVSAPKVRVIPRGAFGISDPSGRRTMYSALVGRPSGPSIIT